MPLALKSCVCVRLCCVVLCASGKQNKSINRGGETFSELTIFCVVRVIKMGNQVNMTPELGCWPRETNTSLRQPASQMSVYAAPNTMATRLPTIIRQNNLFRSNCKQMQITPAGASPHIGSASPPLETRDGRRSTKTKLASSLPPSIHVLEATHPHPVTIGRAQVVDNIDGAELECIIFLGLLPAPARF